MTNTCAGTVIRYANQAGAVDFGTSTTVGSGFQSPTGIAFSAAGDLYVADQAAGDIFKVAGGSTTAVVTGLTSPASIAIDDSSSLYVLQTGAASAIRVGYSNGSYNTNNTSTLGNGFTTLAALAADSAGNLFVTDSGAPAVVELQRTAGSLNLGRINVGSSSIAQSLTLSDAGDMALTFGSPLYSVAGNTGDFTVSTTSTSSCVGSSMLARVTTCGIARTFSPTTTGTRTEILTLSSNSVNGGATAAFTGIGINLPKTTLTLTTNPSGTVSYGTSVAAIASVVPQNTSTTQPTGMVKFFVNGVVYATLPLSGGPVSITISGLPAGLNTIDASYSGDANYAASSGATQTITVTLAQTFTSFSSSISSTTPVPPGTSVTLTATITSAVTTSKPTGTVNFVGKGGTLASAPVNPSTGIATVTTTTLPAGTYSITASYSGDSGFASSSSNPLAVSLRTPQFDISGTPASLTVGRPGSVSTTFSILPISGYVGGFDMSCAGLPANTQCTFTPAVVQFNGTNNTPQAVKLTIATNTPAPTTLAWLAPLGGLLLLSVRRRRNVLVVKHFALYALTGCGSSQGNLTPAGSSTVTVTLIGTPNGTTAPIPTPPSAPVNNLTKPFTFTLNVQ